VNHPASAIAVIRLPHGVPVTSDLACDVAPPVTAGHCRSCRPGQLRLSRFTAAMQPESSRYVAALRSIAARSCSKD
jgi:hypothetical protein